MKKVCILLVSTMASIILLIYDGFAQSIRKPWREMTSAERTDYVNAINALAPTIPQTLSSEHERMAFLFGSNTHIHNSNIFLPWHRVFIYYFEEQLKAINPEVSLPYWDWIDDWSATSTLFQNSSGNSTGLLGRNVNGSVWSHPTQGRAFVRNFASWPQPTQQRLNTLNGITDFTDFSEELELNPHNIGHAQVGGDMNSMFSPIDPVFYLHHAMVDKVWNDWVEQHWNGNNLDFSNDADPNSNMLTFIGYNGSTNASNVVRVNPNDWIDSRDTKVWYAENGQVALNDYSVSGSENYRYTGVINAENNFTVPSGSSCVMVSASQVILKPGFSSLNGSNFTARIDANSFNSRISNNELIAKGTNEGWEEPLLEEVNNQSVKFMVFPNPSAGKFVVSLPEEKLGPYEVANNNSYKVYIYNAIGQIINVINQDGAGSLEINLANKTKGYYIVKVTAATGASYMEKVIIQ